MSDVSPSYRIRRGFRNFKIPECLKSPDARLFGDPVVASLSCQILPLRARCRQVVPNRPAIPKFRNSKIPTSPRGWKQGIHHLPRKWPHGEVPDAIICAKGGDTPNPAMSCQKLAFLSESPGNCAI